jgi:hypothetical protein
MAGLETKLNKTALANPGSQKLEGHTNSKKIMGKSQLGGAEVPFDLKL